MSNLPDRDLHVRADRTPSDQASKSDGLPSWPLTVAFAGFPVWWLLGVVDFIWIPVAVVLLGYLVRSRPVQVPRGFGIWLLFLLCAALSVIGLSQGMQYLGFGYRLASYLACTVLFVYVYNAREALTERFMAGILTVWWLVVVAGGYIALLFPTGSVRTPASLLLPGSLLNNSWVSMMVIRPLNQYNPDSYFQLDPRPSAPFIYTNQWGSVYSLLLPAVIAYLVSVWGKKRFWPILLAIPASFVPAILTTNRGMFLGLGVAAGYAALYMLVRRDRRGIVALAAMSAIVVGVSELLPVSQRLESRSNAPSIVDRAWLYRESISAALKSPFFGYGRTLTVEGAVDPVGTQGEFWIVLVSYGMIAASLFLIWFVHAFVRSTRWRTPAGLAASTTILVALVEVFYYGAIPHSMPAIMIAAAIAMRYADSLPPPTSDFVRIQEF